MNKIVRLALQADREKRKNSAGIQGSAYSIRNIFKTLRSSDEYYISDITVKTVAVPVDKLCWPKLFFAENNEEISYLA